MNVFVFRARTRKIEDPGFWARQLFWEAVDQGISGGPIGLGATEEGAVADYLWQASECFRAMEEDKP